MAKKPSLLDEIPQLPDRKLSGKQKWWDKLATTDPALYEDMVKIIDLHISGDVGVRRKLPSETEVSRWLVEKLAARDHSYAVNTVQQLFRHRRSQANGPQ